MITVEDQILVDGGWYAVSIDLFPCRHWRHRYFGEVAASKTDWPKPDAEPYMSFHYYELDFGALTLRGAWFKALDAIANLRDHLAATPDERPE